jgi:hypothetical protein
LRAVLVGRLGGQYASHVTRFRMNQGSDALAIELTDVGGRQDELLEAFGECQSGHCTCPTDEYGKVAEMDVVATDDTVSLRLEPKPGEQFDTDDISACLDHTIAKVSRG